MTEGEKLSPRFWATITIVVALIGCTGTLLGATVPELIRDFRSKTPIPQATNSLEPPVAIPTETFVVVLPPSSTNTAQVVIASPTMFVLSPLPSEYISIKGFSGVVNSGGVPGDTIYSHLISGKIQYTRVEADDDVQKMELVCKGNQVQDISSSFFLIPQPPSSVFPNYASNVIDVPSDCRIDFYVRDTLGVQSGITIQSVPIQ